MSARSVAAKQGQFTAALQDFAAKAGDNANQVVRSVTGQMLTQLVYRSPVGQPKLWKRRAPAGYVGGRFRANWNIGNGVVDVSTTLRIDQQGGQTIQRGLAELQAADPSQQNLYITNSLPYSIELEYGHSSQVPPAGLVRRTVVEFQTFVDNAVRSLK